MLAAVDRLAPVACRAARIGRNRGGIGGSLGAVEPSTSGAASSATATAATRGKVRNHVSVLVVPHIAANDVGGVGAVSNRKAWEMLESAEQIVKAKCDRSVGSRVGSLKETQKKQDKADVRIVSRRAAEARSDADAGGPMGKYADGDENATRTDLACIGQDLISSNPLTRAAALRRCRKLLSAPQNAPIAEVVEAGMLPSIIAFLSPTEPVEVRLDASWALTNVVAGNAQQTHAVVSHGAIPLLVGALHPLPEQKIAGDPVETLQERMRPREEETELEKEDELREQALWALSNIAGDSPELRDAVLHEGALAAIACLLENPRRATLSRRAAWALSNFCRGRPQPPAGMISQTLPTLVELIGAADAEVQADACWAFAYLCGGTDEIISMVVKTGILARLVDLLGHPLVTVLTPALRALGKIAAGSDANTEAVVASGALPRLADLLSHEVERVRREACWALSNVAAGTPGQIDRLMTCDVPAKVVQLIHTAEDEGTKEEAVWAVFNMASVGEPAHVQQLVVSGCMEPLVALLGADGAAQTQVVALRALVSILRAGQRQKQDDGLPDNPFAALFKRAGGAQRLDALLVDVRHKAGQRSAVVAELAELMESVGR